MLHWKFSLICLTRNVVEFFVYFGRLTQLSFEDCRYGRVTWPTSREATRELIVYFNEVSCYVNMMYNEITQDTITSIARLYHICHWIIQFSIWIAYILVPCMFLYVLQYKRYAGEHLKIANSEIVKKCNGKNQERKYWNYPLVHNMYQMVIPILTYLLIC